jgi:hypothetical protein
MEHESMISELVFSPDGSLLATASPDRTARLWDGHTGRPYGAPIAHAMMVSTVHFDSTGKMLLTASGRSLYPSEMFEAIKLEEPPFLASRWRVADGEPAAPPLRHDYPVVSARFNATGTLIATGSDGGIQLWEAQTGNPVGAPFGSSPSTAHVFGEDGKMLLVGEKHGLGEKVSFWSVGLRRQIGAALEFPGIIFPSVSPDGRTLLICAQPSTQGGIVTAQWRKPATYTWPIRAPWPESAVDVMARVQLQSGLELSPQGELRALSRKQWQERRAAASPFLLLD